MPEPLAPEVGEIGLSRLPEKSNVHIYMGGQEKAPDARPKADIPTRSLYTMISGAIGAVAGYVSSRLYINQKMFDFDTAVLAKTRKDILGRAGIGAAVSETGIAPGLAAGLGTGEIHMANAMELAQTGKFGTVPKFIYKTLGGPQGKSAVALAGAAVVGTAAAAIAYATSGEEKPRAEEPKAKDWADKVASDKEQPRSLT